MDTWKTIKNGLLDENPTFRLVLGMCPTLAISTSVENAFGMGLAATFVLIFSNIFISLLKGFIPSKVRIPAYVVVISTFVILVEMIMKAFLPELDKALGIYIPLIVVNCIILARAEAFASKNNVWLSAMDGLGMGLGFTAALSVLATIREILGAGTWMNIQILPQTFEPALVMLMAPGGFITLGLVLGLLNFILSRKKGGNK